MLIYSCLEIITLILNVTLPTTTTNPRRVRLSAADEIIRHLIADQILITQSQLQERLKPPNHDDCCGWLALSS